MANLPDDARRILDRLEVDHLQHGGANNSLLIRTYTEFHKGGLRRSSIALAIRQAVALGFLKVANSGQRSAAHFRNASAYTLTYVVGRGISPDPSHDWMQIKTDEAAGLALERARVAKRYDTQPKKLVVRSAAKAA